MKLSIITINRNNAEGLRKTLNSVACQTWRDFEHIIIDGASTDNSVEVIREYESCIVHREPCIQLKWLSEPDTGIYNAMNKGIRMAKGEYCLFLNSGDRFIDESSLVNLNINHFSADVVYGDYVMHFDNREEYRVSPDKFNLYTLFTKTIHHSGNAFIRMDAFDKWGLYDETLKIVSDWKWFLFTVGLNGASTEHVNSYISKFDCAGVSVLQEDELNQERGVVAKQLISQRDLEILQSAKEDLDKARDEIRRLLNSKPYKLGYMLLRPIKVLLNK